MSGRWLTAANRFAGYSRHRGQVGNGRVSDLLTRSVLRELCWIAHDSGVVQVGVERLADRLAVTPRAVLLALQRLRDDEWIAQPVRGTGNRHGTQPRESVYVLRPLPDANGDLFPHLDWLQLQWLKYTGTRRWLRLNARNREALRQAYITLPEHLSAVLLGESQGLPDPLLSERRGSTTGTPVHHIETTSTTSSAASSEGPHYRAAARTRATFKVVPTDGHVLADPDPCPHEDPRGPRYCAICRQADPDAPLVTPAPSRPRRQRSGDQAWRDNLPKHCPHPAGQEHGMSPNQCRACRHDAGAPRQKPPWAI